MAKSMYRGCEILDDHHFGTFNLPVRARGLVELDLLENVRTFEYVLKRGDRPDHLAARHLNDEGYWWVILLVNGINYPFASGGWTPGRAIRIPVDVNEVLEKLPG